MSPRAGLTGGTGQRLPAALKASKASTLNKPEGGRRKRGCLHQVYTLTGGRYRLSKTFHASDDQGADSLSSHGLVVALGREAGMDSHARPQATPNMPSDSSRSVEHTGRQT
jgi:hypothetical protein